MATDVRGPDRDQGIADEDTAPGHVRGPDPGRVLDLRDETEAEEIAQGQDLERVLEAQDLRDLLDNNVTIAKRMESVSVVGPGPGRLPQKRSHR